MVVAPRYPLQRDQLDSFMRWRTEPVVAASLIDDVLKGRPEGWIHRLTARRDALANDNVASAGNRPAILGANRNGTIGEKAEEIVAL